MTNSKEGRNRANPLFAVNYIDREIRKDMASTARETVQFPRNVANAMLRINLYLFDHNVRKPFRIRHSCPMDYKHADEAGVEKDLVARLTADFMKKRLFRPTSLELSASARKTIHRQWKTPLKKRPERLWRYLAA